MMDQVGSTLAMEAWDPSQKPNLDWNHAWGTAPANVIPRKLIGIMPLVPGYGKFMIKPQVGTLTNGSYTLPTVKGAVKVAFESHRGQSLVITADIPAATFAKVYLPAFASSGDEILVDNAARNGVREGDFVFVDSVPAGHHVIGRGVPVAMRPSVSASAPIQGLAILAGAHSARFHRADGLSGPAGITLYDIVGNRVAAFSLGASEGDRILPLPPGLYICWIRYAGQGPLPAKFMVR